MVSENVAASALFADAVIPIHKLAFHGHESKRNVVSCQRDVCEQAATHCAVEGVFSFGMR